MRIGIDIRCLMHSLFSGISEYTYNLVINLLALDHENEYVLFYNSAQATAAPKFNARNVTVKEFQYPNKLFNLSMRFIGRPRVDQLIGGVDAFIIPNFLFLRLSPQVAKLLIVHDLTFELYPEFFTFKKRLWHTLIGPKIFCDQADTIVAISENTKQDLMTLYQTDPKKITVINPGVSDAFFEPIPEAELSRVSNTYRLPKKYILSLGNLEPRKNVSGLIDAFESITDLETELLIAGGNAWMYKKLYRQAQASKKKNKIRFLGYVDAADKPALYKLATIFAYPSFYEGFGLPPLEAMAVGTPVVTSASSSLPEAVDSAGLLVNPYNTNELTNALQSLLSAPTLALMLSQAGQAQVRKFRWRQQAQLIHQEILKLKKGVK